MVDCRADPLGHWVRHRRDDHGRRYRRSHPLHSPGVRPELLAIATGAGSLIFSHVNDGGFWLVKEYFNMSVGDTMKTWSISETIMSIIALMLTLALSRLI